MLKKLLQSFTDGDEESEKSAAPTLFEQALLGDTKAGSLKDFSAEDSAGNAREMETQENGGGNSAGNTAEKKRRSASRAILSGSHPPHLMDSYAEKSSDFPEDGALVEGTVIDVDLARAELYVDLPPFGTGLIYGREFMIARDIIKKINIGDTITAKIVERENERGYVELSLKEARAALVWSEAEELVRNEEVLHLIVKDANKGGLIIDWKGVQGFLPASQLGPEHYPRVEDGDKQKIQDELKKLVGERVDVTILTAVPKEGKLIFTEKGMGQQERSEIVDKYTVGDDVDGEITGIVDFGVFVKVEDGLEGLVHISELDWGLVEDPRRMFKVGEKIRAKVIDVSNGKISLSIKALKENPWIAAKDKYKKGDDVKGVIIKYNKYGALASIEEGVAGLVHISEFGTEEKLRETLELGRVYPFCITHFDPKDQKMALAYGREKGEKK